MLISFDWLKTLIDIKKSPEEISDLLTFSGLEVEGLQEVESVKGGLKGIVIGEVLTCEKHPDADKLKVTTVDLGLEEPKQIVCGAPNVATGQKVVVATVNCTLYPEGHEPFKIKKSKIRGQVSEGMICAEDEIGLGASHDGIMVLDTDMPNGTPAAEFFNLSSDYVIEIGLTPNRADGASHFGVARDIKALTGEIVNLPNVDEFKEETEDFDISVQNTEACPRYSGVVIKGVEVKPSPEWMQKRLRAIGINPTNNVVDATNYVLHELGQPLHAFDLAAVGNKIVVKTGLAGTKFTTLDEKERTLLEDDLMICNATEPMCIAGTLGGSKSGVTDSTTDIFLESAYFDAAYVRKSAMKHTIKTDASFRYERGTDPNITIYALKRAALLIQEIAGGEVTSKVVDVYPNPIADFEFEVKHSYINTIIGKELKEEKVESILNSLDIEITSKYDGVWKVKVPPYRVDVTRPADIAEEVLRIYGYNNIELSDLSTDYFAHSKYPEKHQLKETVSETLNGFGYTEIITNSLTNSNYYEDKNELVNILNYNSEDLDVMRKTMIHSGLEVLVRNINRKNANLKFYEFGKTYSLVEEKYVEKEKLSFYLTGNKNDESWGEASKNAEFVNLYTAVSSILERTGFADVQLVNTTNDEISAGASIQYNKREIGVMGLMKGSEVERLGVDQQVWYAELDWQYISKKYKDKSKFSPLSKFPAVRRDLSLVVDRSVTFAEIEKIAQKYVKGLLQEVNVFDVYEGDKLEAGKKSYSVNFILQDAEKTLNDKVIDKIHSKLIDAYEKEIGAVIRR